MKIIILDDSVEDAKIVKKTLETFNSDYTCVIVGSRSDFLMELQKKGPKIVLSDYSMPNFHGIEALDLVLKESPLTPFVFISGTIINKKQLIDILPGISAFVDKSQLSALPEIITMAEHEINRHKQYQRTYIKNTLLHIGYQFDLLDDYLATLDSDYAPLKQKLKQIRKNIDSTAI